MGNTPPSIYMTQHHMQEILSHSQSHPSQSLPRDKTLMSPKQPTLIPPFKRQRIDITPSHITHIENEPISAPIPISPHTHLTTHLSGRAASEPLPHGTRSRSSSLYRSSSPRSSSPLPRDPHHAQIQIYALMKADPSMFGYAMRHSPRASPQPTYIPSPTPHIPTSTSAISSSLSTSTTTMNTSTSPPTSTSTSTPTPICMDPSTEMSQRWDAWQQSLQPSEDEDESEDDESETPTSPFILSTSSPAYASSSSSPSYASSSSSSSSSPSPTSFSSPSFPSTSHRRPKRTRPLTLRHQLHLDQINRKRKLQSDTTSWGWEPISPACSETSSCSSPSISISTSSPTPALSVLTWSTDSPSSSFSFL